jgi:hypothetical protein
MGKALKCDACGQPSPDPHVLEAEGGPTPNCGVVVAVRIKLCALCYSGPNRFQIVNSLCADVLVPSVFWSGRGIAWSSVIRIVSFPRRQRVFPSLHIYSRN